MAAKFTEVTLEDMDRFLKRAYRALRPKRGESRGEVYYDLNLSRGNLFVRVWTSIRPRSGSGAGVGEDAIRVTMVTKGGKGLMPKGKIVKRTQNWRSSLQDRVDELVETYESKKGYWDDRQKSRDEGQAEPTKDDRDTDDDRDEERAQPEEKPSTGRSGDPHEGQFTKLPNDTWGARIFAEGSPGDHAILSTKGGKRLKVTLQERVWKGADRFNQMRYAETWTFEAPGGRRYAFDDEVPDRVAARYMQG